MTVSNDLKEAAQEICVELAEPSRPAAACLCGPSVYGDSPKLEDLEILLICNQFREGLRYEKARVGKSKARVLVVDRLLFELDAKKGTLGEFVVARILNPYEPLINAEYLESIEIEAKARVIEEEVHELVTERGELARGIIISPEYFVLARAKRRARIFMPARREYARMFAGATKERNIRIAAAGYRKAMNKPSVMAILNIQDDKATIKNELLDKLLSKKATEHVVNIVRLSRVALQSYLAHGRAAYLNLDILTKELGVALLAEIMEDSSVEGLLDPNEFLFLRTSTGIVTLNERASIIEIARRIRPGSPLTVTPLGGVLNDVYLVSIGSEKLVAKRFTDWHGFKWFTLSLVSLGTRTFSIGAETRLGNEYGINRFLYENDIPVPEIVHVSVPHRMLLEKYIHGKSVVDLVKEAMASEKPDADIAHAGSELGEAIARIHATGVAVGDCKPENFIKGVDGKIYVLDLEQAKRSGDKAWDIAEFLYYSGHYAFTQPVTRGFNSMLEAFIEGYARNGESAMLRKASSIRYSKVFSLWTPPQVIYEISRRLASAGL